MRVRPRGVRLPPARPDERNAYVYLDLLGYFREQHDALVDRGLVGASYPSAHPAAR